MLGDLVAIDLETTGFDPARESIIEIGAVKTRDGKIVEEFGTLIDPGRPIPAAITALTGIEDSDVQGKPLLADVIPQLNRFVGGAAFIAHNIHFDSAFLYRQGILQGNPRIDTLELASALFPRAPRYNLGSLAAEVGVPLETAHRAVHDARATAGVFWALWNKLMSLPYGLVEEMYRAMQQINWDGRWTLEQAYAARAHEAFSRAPFVLPSFAKPNGIMPITPTERQTPISAQSVRDVLDEGGTLAAQVAQYERRPQQLQMADAVLNALNNGTHLLCEAGTGTGKSLAYLTPAALWALQNGERVAVSTYTINLQEQLIGQDVPLLQAALEQPLRAAVMKGRANYLCLNRLELLRHRLPANADELRVLIKLLVWLHDGGTGDRSDINMRGGEETTIWNELSAEADRCTTGRCRALAGGGCLFYKARMAAEEAHIVIVNHALLISDAMNSNRALPEYRHLIVDEAHQLEDAVTNGLTFRVDEAALRRHLQDLHAGRRGLLPAIIVSARESASEKDRQRVVLFAEQINAAVAAMNIHLKRVFDAAREVIRAIHRGDEPLIRVTGNAREKQSFVALVAAWDTLAEFLQVVSEALLQLASALTRIHGRAPLAGGDDLISATENAARYFTDITGQLNAFVRAPDPNYVYWFQPSNYGEGVAMFGAPINIGQFVEDYLWREKRTVVMTSATLQTAHSFDYIASRLRGENVPTLDVGTPFDYKQSTLLFLPTDVPDPNERGKFQQAVERGIIELAAALGGKTLVLFTSYTQLKQAAAAIEPRLALGGITVLGQNESASRALLLETFKREPKAVLLGTRSFWEGIDIPGDQLSALVIVRLPFAVPTDPVVAARSEQYADSFKEYTLPDGILRFRQGFGRLIRTASDRGIVAVFDGRILSKGYGATILQSLPECTLHTGPLAQLPSAAQQWLQVGSNGVTKP